MAFIFPFGKKTLSSQETEACVPKAMNSSSPSPAAGVPIPDFPFREPAVTEGQATASAATPSPAPAASTATTVPHLDELRKNLDHAVHAALQQFHAYVDAVLATAPQRVSSTRTWELPEGLPQDAFPFMDTLSDQTSSPRVRLDASFKEKLDLALAQAFAEPAQTPSPEPPPLSAPASETALPPPLPSSPEATPKTVLPPPRQPASSSPATAAQAIPLTAVPAVPVALAVEATSPFIAETVVSTTEPSTPFALASAERTSSFPAAPSDAPSPFSVVAPASATPLKPELDATPKPLAHSPFQSAPEGVDTPAGDAEDIPLPAADDRPSSPFSSPFAIPGTSPVPAVSSEPGLPVPPLAVETPAPLPFSPFQGLEPAPPPPLLDQVQEDMEGAAFMPMGNPEAEPGTAFGATTIATPTAVLEPAPPVIRPAAPPVVPPASLPPSRATSPAEPRTSSEGIGFSFAELLKANGQTPH